MRPQAHCAAIVSLSFGSLSIIVHLDYLCRCDWDRRPDRPRAAIASTRMPPNNPAMDPHPTRDSRRPLAHRALELPGRGVATDYARALLESLGARVSVSAGPDDVDPAPAWARSGLMALTGAADGLPQMCPAPLASCADGTIKALRCIALTNNTNALPTGSSLLGERAAIAQLHRNGAISPGGGCRLLPAADGWFAISLTRDDDWSAVPAWLEDERLKSWDAIATAVASRSVGELVERARLLGLAASASTPPATTPTPWVTVTDHGPVAPAERTNDPPRVVDLSPLWAGPLCSHLLQALGARVIKVESLGRPDGARNGPREFYDLLNFGKRSVALDFGKDGLERLHELLDWADVVIEAARPRGLRQLGVIAEECIARRRGLTWVSITGYGRDEPQCNWTAFGDDAGVAAGLSALMRQVSGMPLFCGDAIADPLTGMHAALAAWASHQGGGGRLLSLPLRDVVTHCIGFSRPEGDPALHERWQAWTQEVRDRGLDTTPPTARPAAGRARSLGADTDTWLSEWGNRC